MPKFTIVKNAGVNWEFHFVQDPKDGVHVTFSAANTYSGKKLGVKETYDDKRLAELDCDRLNTDNPSGNYEVCPVL